MNMLYLILAANALPSSNKGSKTKNNSKNLTISGSNLFSMSFSDLARINADASKTALLDSLDNLFLGDDDNKSHLND